MNDNDQFFKLLTESIRKIPELKWALGVVGLVAAVAIIDGIIGDTRKIIFGVVVLIVFMITFVIFAKLSRTKDTKFHSQIMFLSWAVILLVVATALLGFTSLFFNWPLKFNEESKSITKSLETNDLHGKITVAYNYCEKRQDKDEKVKIKIVNTDILPTLHNICDNFVIHNVKGHRGQFVTYTAKSDNFEDKGEFILWKSSTNIVLLR